MLRRRRSLSSTISSWPLICRSTIFISIVKHSPYLEGSILTKNHETSFSETSYANLDHCSADRVIVFDGQPGVDAHANTPESLLTGCNSFLKNLDVTFRRDPTNYRPRINKGNSQLDQEQKLAGNYVSCPLHNFIIVTCIYMAIFANKCTAARSSSWRRTVLEISGVPKHNGHNKNGYHDHHQYNTPGHHDHPLSGPGVLGAQKQSRRGKRGDVCNKGGGAHGSSGLGDEGAGHGEDGGGGDEPDG